MVRSHSVDNNNCSLKNFQNSLFMVCFEDKKIRLSERVFPMNSNGFKLIRKTAMVEWSFHGITIFLKSTNDAPMFLFGNPLC